MVLFIYLSSILLFTSAKTVSCLYPRESLYREIKSLDGIWLFKICGQDDQDIGFRNEWHKMSLEDTGDVIPMAVPSSFNDITQNKTIRDYLGWSWYEKNFFIQNTWNSSRIVLRFGSAHYFTIVYLNGNFIMNHTGGHLPFEADITSHVNFSGLNRITVALNNTLSNTTIPQGSKTFKTSEDGPYPPGFYEQGTNFDFFNYAGIHRSVVLYSTPKIFIDDVSIMTGIDKSNKTGTVYYNISTSNAFGLKNSNVFCTVAVLDKSGKTIATKKSCDSSILIKDAHYWWPYGSNDEPGYLYTLHIQTSSGTIIDEYYQPFGIRTVELTEKNLFINDYPIYLLGFGKHEDSNIRGKGVDIPLILKDFNLIKWIGANSFRTSHYPYADEIMDRADAEGIMVIDECPAVGLKSFDHDLLQQHKKVLTELIMRDKNHPSVIAWSVANEPSSTKSKADKYFKEVVSHVKSIDSSHRPVTAALNADYNKEKAGKYLDFVMLNHYFSWYSDAGSTEVIKPLLVNYMTKAFDVYRKPIMMSEYGGDTVAGLHMDPPFLFTEDYQVELMMRHHEAFDELRRSDVPFIGEHIWNFADFLTIQRDPSVGKSAIIHTFLHDSDKFQKNYIMTCAVETKTKIISVPDTEDAVELYLFDSAGRDIYLDFQTQMWQHPSLVCVVFDLTDENSFNSCSKWLDVVKNTGLYFTIPGVLIGSKSDLKERRVVKANVAQDYARKNNLRYFECSAKENKGVEEPFFYLVNEWHKMYLEKTEYFKSIS